VLADRILTIPKRNGPPCCIGDLIALLPPNEVRSLNALLVARTMTDDDKVDAFKAEGVEVTERGGQWVEITKSAIGNHRRKQCRCFR
jgi:hypothetical protein